MLLCPQTYSGRVPKSDIIAKILSVIAWEHWNGRMMERFRTWHEVLMERLSDPEDVIGYLEVSLEEYLEDGDTAFFLKE